MGEKDVSKLHVGIKQRMHIVPHCQDFGCLSDMARKVLCY